MDPAVEGLRFQCQPGCTACCEVNGFVYLGPGDVARAAAFLKMDPTEFERQFVYRTRHRTRLRKPGDGRQCHFLRDGGCSIHPAKPTQCRLFPFWPELVDDRKAWRRTAAHCPGIGQGPLVQIGTAKQLSAEMETAYPAIYLSFGGSA
ncbi:MAG: YkgJ family cysteine cluster protein [Bryobacterales bacterium]|nr:YkgJ family cysteine cluster protein [Bryobacterales bacterium]